MDLVWLDLLAANRWTDFVFGDKENDSTTIQALHYLLPQTHNMHVV